MTTARGVPYFSDGAATPMDTVTESIFSGDGPPRRFAPSSACFGRSAPRTAIL